MSTTIGAIGGKERRGILNFWILILTIAILLLGINFYFSTRYAQQEADARDLVANIQVQSQQIAKFAQEAAAGGLESFSELRAPGIPSRPTSTSWPRVTPRRACLPSRSRWVA